ncbi:MAG: response regulator [Christensenellales bacterium]
MEEQIARFCKEKGRFPRIEPYRNQESFFNAVLTAAFSHAVIALPGVAGLNAVEHLRALCPRAGSSGAAIWFSLRLPAARRLFSLEPVTEEGFRRGFSSGWKGDVHRSIFIRFQ